MQYYRCGVCCRLVECARDLTLLWAHTSFPPSWVCVCLHVFALFMHACLRSLYAETHEHVRLRLHYMYVFVCLCDPAKALLLLLLLLTQGAACLPQLFALTPSSRKPPKVSLCHLTLSPTHTNISRCASFSYSYISRCALSDLGFLSLPAARILEPWAADLSIWLLISEANPKCSQYP